MILILDANIIFAALLRDSKTREILLYPFYEFYVPEFVVEEIRKILPTLIEQTETTKEKLDELLALFLSRVTIVPEEDYSHKLAEADELIGEFDKSDIPYLALALSIPNNGIWSNDNVFSKQTKIKHWFTKDILERFKK